MKKNIMKNTGEGNYFLGIFTVSANTDLYHKSSYVCVMVEAEGVEPSSENSLIQLSPGAECHLIFLWHSAGTQALCRGSRFLHDLFNSIREVHVHY